LDQNTFERLMNIIHEMESCLPFELKYRSLALGSLLQLFLIYCHYNLNFNSVQLDEENASVCILRDFKLLIEEKYQEWHKVQDYASEIHISAKHLSQTVKNFTGKTAKTLIQDRLILEAKRLLLHSSLTIKEIAYQIGFNEPLHFSGFFKKKVNISPSEFKNQKI
jgi:AraC-like DNA-binding protein